MNAVVFDPRDLRPPHERGTGKALLLALGMHVLLFVLLWVGVSWKSEEPATVEAELWSSVPQFAAPAPRATPAPQPEPEPAPPPRPAPPPPPAPRVEETPKPDIALERKREEDRRKADALAREQEQRKKAEELKREQERERLEKEKQAKLDAQKQAELDKKKAALEKKQADERFNRQVQQLAAMAGQSNGTVVPNGAPGTGDAARTSGPRGDSGYAARVAARIRGNTVFDVPRDLAGNPTAKFEVSLDPAGYVVSVRKTASSGVPGFDEAVERAIHKSEPYPPDASGKPPSSLTITHRPKDR